MTLVLEIQWSIESTKVAVFDTATQTDVGEGRSAHPEPVNHQTDPAHWWSALVDATRHAVDGAAAMGITDAEIRTVMLDVAPAPGGLVILDSSGDIVGPALLGSHEASAPDAEWLVSGVDGGADAWLAVTGVLPAAIDHDRDWNVCLPRTVDATTPVGRMSPAASAELGIAPGLPIHLGSSIAR